MVSCGGAGESACAARSRAVELWNGVKIVRRAVSSRLNGPVVAVVASAALVLLGACSAADTPAEQPSATEATEPDATPAEETRTCGTATEEDAVAAARAAIDSAGLGLDGVEFSPATDQTRFDPCADLSALHMYPDGWNSRQSTHVALYHRGEFLSLGRQEVVSLIGSIAQVDPASVEVHYIEYTEPSDPTEPAESRVVLRWDEGEQTVVREGDLLDRREEVPVAVPGGPGGPGEAIPEAGGAESTAGGRAPVPGAYAGVGAPLPPDVIELPTSGGYGLLRTPSGNIGCELTAEFSGCGVESYITDETYGVDPGGDPRWFFYLSADGPGSLGSKGDAPAYHEANGHTVTTVPYGKVATWGDWACASESAGLTCWNIKTGHGAFLNKARTQGF